MINGSMLRAVGEVLYGRHWRRDFEDTFNISNRTLRRMLSGDQSIPAGLVSEMEQSVRDHGNRLDAILETLVDAQEPVS